MIESHFRSSTTRSSSWRVPSRHRRCAPLRCVVDSVCVVLVARPGHRPQRLSPMRLGGLQNCRERRNARESRRNPGCRDLRHLRSPVAAVVRRSHSDWLDVARRRSHGCLLRNDLRGISAGCIRVLSIVRELLQPSTLRSQLLQRACDDVVDPTRPEANRGRKLVDRLRITSELRALGYVECAAWWHRGLEPRGPERGRWRAPSKSPTRSIVAKDQPEVPFAPDVRTWPLAVAAFGS